jgi:hypothetical protein
VLQYFETTGYKFDLRTFEFSDRVSGVWKHLKSVTIDATDNLRDCGKHRLSGPDSCSGRVRVAALLSTRSIVGHGNAT